MSRGRLTTRPFIEVEFTPHDGHADAARSNNRVAPTSGTGDTT